MNEKLAPRSFYATQPAPCPYLQGRIEQRIVTPFSPADDPALFDALNRAGFRRSHGFLYRPACPGCQACIPVRIVVEQFTWTRRFKKVWKRNVDLVATRLSAVSTDEQYALFKRYLDARHDDGGMAKMSRADYADMIEQSTPQTSIIEFRENGSLVAVALTDRLRSGLSGVYKFYEPELAARSLGTFVILWHVEEATRLHLPYFYLGYWIENARKMSYKTQFRPVEQLTSHGWRTIAVAETDSD